LIAPIAGIGKSERIVVQILQRPRRPDNP
jgi:hypothetical protein